MKTGLLLNMIFRAIFATNYQKVMEDCIFVQSSITF